MDYRNVPTSPEVLAVIRAKHRELKVFSSFSDPCGDFNPVIETISPWNIIQECDYNLLKSVHEHWCCP